MDRLPPEGVKEMTVLLITYLETEVPIEKWQELAPDQIVQSARKMLKARDDVVAQSMRNLRMALDKSHEKGRSLAQEVLGAQDGQRLAEEGEQQELETENLAKYEVDELTHRLEECDQTIEELNAEITSTTQEMENYRVQSDKVKLELDVMLFQSSGHGRRVTLLRSDDEVTVGGVLQSLKERSVSATRNPALKEKYDASLDFLSGKTEEDGENSFQHRMVKDPLKTVDLANVLKEVDRVVKETPKFTVTMGEKSEKVVGFILEILVKLQLPPPRVTLMDAMWASKDAGGDMMKAIQTFFAIRNNALEAAETETAKEGIMAATGDDGRILAKIIEVAFVPISPALTHQITGDVNQYVIRDVGKALNQGFAAFAAAIRLMTKADIMEMVNDLFELVLHGTEHFVNREAHCLGSLEEYVTERITVFEKKYEPITGNLFLKACKVRSFLQDSKGDSTVKDCNRLLENLPQFQ